MACVCLDITHKDFKGGARNCGRSIDSENYGFLRCTRKEFHNGSCVACGTGNNHDLSDVLNQDSEFCVDCGCKLFEKELILCEECRGLRF